MGLPNSKTSSQAVCLALSVSDSSAVWPSWLANWQIAAARVLCITLLMSTLALTGPVCGKQTSFRSTCTWHEWQCDCACWYLPSRSLTCHARIVQQRQSLLLIIQPVLAGHLYDIIALRDRAICSLTLQPKFWNRALATSFCLRACTG